MQQQLGSGKTAVLVERIINKIINEKIDIDKILVVTFTKSAAAEMRGRVLDAIYKEIEKNPDNMHLQKQITLLPKASICTIDSFCLDIVKNNFFEIDIAPNLKIAEQTEIEILKMETIEDLFEEKYEAQEKDFLRLINIYTGYRGDDLLKSIILETYGYIQSMPFPNEWLKEKIEMFNQKEISFEKTVWGEILLKKVREVLKDGILKLEKELEHLKYEEDTEKFIVTLSEDIRKITCVYEKEIWDEVYFEINELSLDRLPVDKKIPDEIKNRIKEIRNKVKDEIKKIGQNIMIYDSKEANENIREMYDILQNLQKLVIEFSDRFAKAKQDRNIMDFNDIEHFALNILASEKNNVSDRYKKKYEEILIDEYQDSNLVQEYILNKISRNNNIFMVGDVKQSIYKFRGARPELFLEKYETYKTKEYLKENVGEKIQLFKNFRSRKNILDLTNIVFENIMSKELGDIDYNEEEYLNLGAEYPEGKRLETELYVIDLKEEEESIYKGEEKEDEEQIENIEDILLEAKFVANKVKELVDSGYLICNKDKTYRNITYKDIAILLRSTSNLAPIYEQEISKLNLPVFCDVNSRIPRFSRNKCDNEFT